jgi:hypothetical protein
MVNRKMTKRQIMVEKYDVQNEQQKSHLKLDVKSGAP